MKLKSITTHGFKSFADRINVHFHNGITGVIGPNGSGKSNVIDAVRWVMGEQTAKQLRADDPTDIIFAGSQKRKPLSMAEVSLTFINTGVACPPEFLHLPEISIGRRIYRDGSREYFMNKQPCRLKDITEFLMSIGLGSRSYSIIQQEKRDRIIQASPQGLREIIEETAGISVFKTHRKDAEKRLNSAVEKLAGLGEVEAELSTRSEKLADQVERAEQKIKLTKELKHFEITSLCQDVGFYCGIRNQITHDMDKINSQDAQENVDSSSWEAQATELQAKELELTVLLKETEDTHDEKKLVLTKYYERIQNFKDRHTEHTKRLSDLTQLVIEEQDSIKRDEERLQESLTSLEQLEKDLIRIDGEIDNLAMELEEVEESLQVERIRGEEIRSEIKAIDELLVTLRTQNEGQLLQIERINKDIQRYQEEKLELAAQLGTLQADRNHSKQKLEEISAGMESAGKIRLNLETQLGSFQEQESTLLGEKNKIREELMEVSSTYNSLEKLNSQGEGLSEGTRLLREELSQYISGFLYENTTLHPEDEDALEQGFPEALEAAIVNNQEDYVELLDKAEELSLTRVHLIMKEAYLKLSTEEEQNKQKILEIPGVRNVGDRLSSCQLPTLKNYLQRIFIVRDEWILFKALRDIPHKNNPTFIFLTERGVLLQATGLSRFGLSETGESQGLLRRRRELEELKVSKEALQERLAQQSGEIYKLEQAKGKVQEQLNATKQKISAEQTEVHKLSSTLETQELHLKNARTGIEKCTREIERLAEDMGSIKETFAKNQQQIDDSEREKARHQENLDAFEEESHDKKERKDILSTQIQARKTDRSVLVERQSQQKRSYEELSEHIQRLRNRLNKNMLEKDDLKTHLDNAKQSEESLHNEISVLEKNVLELEQKRLELQEEKESVAEEKQVIENRIKDSENAKMERERKINDKKLELARAEAALDGLYKDAKDRFNLEKDQLPSDEVTQPIPKNKLEKDIEKTKKQIEGIGPVNESAMEEYQEVMERRDFLDSQRQDIQKSVTELEKAIAEIEETTKTRFEETFNFINTEFQKLFPILFPGGSGILKLLNPDDMLTTGVEIMVQLPGKRMQNMSLFSGGEKALTAISLIFALLKTRPAPFCFLDEVDAPLDEANVGRFNRVIEALSEQFQFVVITHNRRTMEVLDTIYGISMPEPGISKLVSVDLTDVPQNLKKPAREKRPGASARG